jgi:hypothetical protein
MSLCPGSWWLGGALRACASSPQDFPVNFQQNCTVAGGYTTRMSMVPKKWPTGLPLNGYSLPMDDPPQVPGGTCNFAMPDDSTRDRYLWVRLLSGNWSGNCASCRGSSSATQVVPLEGCCTHQYSSRQKQVQRSESSSSSRSTLLADFVLW